MSSPTSTIAQMASQVSARLEDPQNIFWSLQMEVYAGLAEAISEMMLIIGRPTVIFNQLVTLAANTVWQPMPAGVLAITDVYQAGGRVWKTTLHSLDYMQGSWSGAWESDRAAQPARWAPLGLNYFVVHPAPLQPVQVSVTGVAYPITTPWPPSGQEVSPFHKEINQALEMYAAAYCRLKEIGDDAQVGMELYQRFLEIGQRLTQIEDRRDALVWTRGQGVSAAPSHVAWR